MLKIRYRNETSNLIQENMFLAMIMWSSGNKLAYMAIYGVVRGFERYHEL